MIATSAPSTALTFSTSADSARTVPDTDFPSFIVTDTIPYPGATTAPGCSNASSTYSLVFTFPIPVNRGPTLLPSAASTTWQARQFPPR